MADDRLLASWSMFRAALSGRAPASAALIAPPAPETTALSRRLGLARPDVVETWFSLHDGAGLSFDGGMVLPGNFALSQAGAIESTEMIRQTCADDDPGLTDDTSGDPDLAGEVAGTWLPDYVSLGSNGCGGGLFVDLRPGQLHGCVRTWDQVNADSEEVEAASLAAFIQALAVSIGSGQRYKFWTPTCIAGQLDWTVDPRAG